MQRLLGFLRTSIGRKVLMGITGLGLIVFLIAHVAGNLQIFLPPDAINSYAENLKSHPPLLWTMRTGLALTFLVHIVLGLSLARENKEARPQRYMYPQDHQSTPFYATYMAVSGFLILVFLIFHLAHFTWGWILPNAFALHDEQGRHDVYGMVIAGFSNWAITVGYIVAMVLLAFHLLHAAQSFMQSLGIFHDKYTPMLRRFATGVVILIVLGKVSIPLAIFMGLVGSGGGH